MAMHAARIENSERLQAVLAVLSRGGRWSTRDLVEATGRYAINSIVAELRENGFRIECKPGTEIENGRKKKVWRYRLVPPAFNLEAPPGARDAAGAVG